MDAGDRSARITLAYDDTDFDTARALSVTIVAAAHSRSSAIISASVPVNPSPDAVESSLALSEDGPGAARVDKAAQTVTVTAQTDDDANDETVPVPLAAAGVGGRATVTLTDSAFPAASFIAEPGAGEGPGRRLRGSWGSFGRFPRVDPRRVAYDA